MNARSQVVDNVMPYLDRSGPASCVLLRDMTGETALLSSTSEAMGETGDNSLSGLTTREGSDDGRSPFASSSGMVLVAGSCEGVAEREIRDADSALGEG